jgi:hypothetical protein
MVTMNLDVEKIPGNALMVAQGQVRTISNARSTTRQVESTNARRATNARRHKCKKSHKCKVSLKSHKHKVRHKVKPIQGEEGRRRRITTL